MKLFEPASIGTLTVKNRLVMPPMNSRTANTDGTVSQRTIDYYARRARGGVGLIEVEIAAVDPVYVVSHTQLRLSDDRFIAGLSRLARAIKENGARAAVQLHHPGRQAPSSVTGAQPVAPSPIPSRTNREVPRELTPAEIETLVERFAEAACRAREAGFEAIELHAAHGYLLCQFLSPYSNRRQDGFGGDTLRRARFPLEIIHAVRRRLGQDFPIIFRFSAEEHVEGGLTLEESCLIARMVEGAGVNAISVSAGTDGTLEWAVQPMLLPKGCLVPSAVAIRREVNIPVIAVGRLGDPELAERALQEGMADFIAVGRPLLADPDLPRKAEAAQFDQIRRCIACNSCRREPGAREIPICCLLNPETGREGEPESPAAHPRRVLVIGAGPAGLEAARVARLRGHQVVLWEESRTPGGRWSFLLRRYLTQQMKELHKLGVTVQLGKKADPQSLAEMSPQVVLATPQGILSPPVVPGIERQEVVSAQAVLEGKARVEGRVVVWGGGNIGCELALHLSHRRVEIAVLESGNILGYGLEPATSKVLVERLRQQGVRFHTGVQVVEICPGAVLFRDSQGSPLEVAADAVVLAPGERASEALPQWLSALPVEAHALPYCGEPSRALRAAQAGASLARQI